MKIALGIAALGLTLAVGATSQAKAATSSRYDYQSAAGVCQGNSSAYAGNLRFRALQVDNIGTTLQYVTCALQGDDSTGRGASAVFVEVANNDTVSHDISCILVNGYRQGTSVNATFTTKVATVAPGSSAFIEWVPSDVVPAVTSIELPQIQCGLPGATALDYTGKNYSEDVGT